MFVCIKTKSHFRGSFQAMDQAKPKSKVLLIIIYYIGYAESNISSLFLFCYSH